MTKYKKSLLLYLIIAILTTSCTNKLLKKEQFQRQSAMKVNENLQQIKSENLKKIDNYVKNLPLEQKISQLFIENLEGCNKFRSYETIGDITGEEDNTPLIAGGYLYFSYNISDTPEEMKAFNQSVEDYSKKYSQIPPFLAVDQEGGLVTRLKNLSPALPSNQTVAEENTVAQAYNIYKEQAVSMKELGFHMNLAPVIEVCTPDNEEFLNGRSFGNSEQVLNYARACVNAYENNGIATVVKHFPGNTNTDPHTGLPEIKLTKDKLFDSIKPFIQVLDYNPQALLMSHAVTDAVDPGVPACVSKVWVTDILRNKLGYNGIIFSDDIFMGALADNGYEPEKAALMAINAGVDCIMISQKRFAQAGKILYEEARKNQEFMEKIDNSVKRIITYKIKAGILNI